MNQPRLAGLHDAENRLRRDWLAFTEVWQRTGDVWRDQRRQQFETRHLAQLPGVMSRTAAEIAHFRETLHRALQAISDDEATR